LKGRFSIIPQGVILNELLSLMMDMEERIEAYQARPDQPTNSKKSLEISITTFAS